jgi:hypothetical protein
MIWNGKGALYVHRNIQPNYLLIIGVLGAVSGAFWAGLT